MSNITNNDWFWPSVAVIVAVVMGFNTVRDINKDKVAEVCLQQHKSIQYSGDGNIVSCK